MTKEELIAFLKENLTIEIDTQRTDFYSKGVSIVVHLLLDGEKFPSSETYESFRPD